MNGATIDEIRAALDAVSIRGEDFPDDDDTNLAMAAVFRSDVFADICGRSREGGRLLSAEVLARSMAVSFAVIGFKAGVAIGQLPAMRDLMKERP